MSRRKAVPLLAIMIVVSSLSGCRGSVSPELIQQVQEQLQIGNSRKALDLFAGLGRLDAESHYLKAVALEDLERRDAAESEIALALKQEPNDPKYRGFQLRLRLFGGDREAIDQLIELHRQHESSGAASLFAVFARQANAMQFTAQGKVQGAQAQNERELDALKTALVLAAEIPEFQRELIQLALSHRLPAEAVRLIARLRELDPDNTGFARQHISALLLNQQLDAALKESESLFRRNPKSLGAAQTLSTVLSQSEANADHDRMFDEVLRAFPIDNAIVPQYALYLTRSGRLDQAGDVIDNAISRQKEKDERQRLIQLAIALPLEAVGVAAEERANRASERLKKYGSEITKPILVTYYEGRILYLRGKSQEALEKMKQVLAEEKNEAGRLRPFGQEALQWIRRIMADGLVDEQLKKAIEAIESVQNPGQTAPAEKPSDKSGGEKETPATDAEQDKNVQQPQ